MSEGAVPAIPSRAVPEEQEASLLFRWVSTVDHKRIGLLYLWTSLGFFAVGGIFAMLLRIQLARPGNDFLAPGTFNQLFTMHGTTMIFLVVMPALVGFANYLVPLMIGARDMAFPRLNAMSYWLFLFGGLLLYFSFAAGGAPAAGWFSYPPLSETPYSSTPGVDYWVVSLLVLGIGSVAAAVNLTATILALRAAGMSLRALPLFVWMMLVTAALILLALPALNASIVMLLIDRQLSARFFIPWNGGSALLWQHFFWSFGHPEVYILALPAFGMISEVVPVFARRPIFGYGAVAVSSVAIGLLSLGVWAHHMFTVGLGHAPDLAFSAASLLIAVPTGMKVLNWSATLWGGSIRLTVAMKFALAFLVQFTIGGLSGVTFATVPADWQTTDTYYVVAHFHYVLFGGTLFGVYAGLYYWFPKMSGRILSENLGSLHFWLTVLGFNGTFFVQHLLGLMGMPRRVYTYPDLPYWGALNLISTVGAGVLGASVLVLLFNILRTLQRGKPAGDNPWNAWTLEWATSSPPPEGNFGRLPPVRSRRPLWDLEHPDAPDPAVSASGKRDDPRPAPWKAGILGFIVSEATFFLMLIIAFVFYNLTLESGPRARGTLDPWRTGAFTACLIASSISCGFAERETGSRGSSGRFRAWLGLTLLLGATFLVGQALEYRRLMGSGVTLGTNLFASTFFTLTGFHGLHVCVGLVLLATVLGLTWSKEKRDRLEGPLRGIVLYWHFVDAVWIGVFSAVYLAAPSL